MLTPRICFWMLNMHLCDLKFCRYKPVSYTELCWFLKEVSYSCLLFHNQWLFFSFLISLKFTQDSCYPSSREYGSRFSALKWVVQWHLFASFVSIARDTGNLLSPVYNSFFFCWLQVCYVFCYFKSWSPLIHV